MDKLRDKVIAAIEATPVMAGTYSIAGEDAEAIADAILDLPEIRAALILLEDSRDRLGVVEMPETNLGHSISTGTAKD